MSGGTEDSHASSTSASPTSFTLISGQMIGSTGETRHIQVKTPSRQKAAATAGTNSREATVRSYRSQPDHGATLPLQCPGRIPPIRK